MGDDPFFVLGSKRGGTTFFRLMLNAHPQIEIPKESHFLIPLFQKGSSVQTVYPSNRQEITDAIVRGGRFATWSTQAEQVASIVRSAPDGTPLRDVISQVYRAEVGSSAKIVGDKTPEYIDYFDCITSTFPKAKIIFLVRDPRDVNDSLASRGWEGWTVFQRGLYLRRILRTVIKRQNNDNVLVVKYEELIRSNEETLRKVVSFLGVSYDSRMLTFHENVDSHITEREKESGVHQNLSRVASAKDIEKWRRFAPQKYYPIECLCENEMRQLGYEPMLVPPVYMSSFASRLAVTGYFWCTVAGYHVLHGLIPRNFKRALRQTRLYAWLRKTVRG